MFAQQTEKRAGDEGRWREGAVIDRASISVAINAPRRLPIAVRQNSQAVADALASRP
jgi:hypothetical protein